jgi:hypothetical protein
VKLLASKKCMEKEMRLTVHSFRGAKLLELCLHWRVWPHVAGLHPALIKVSSDKDMADPVFAALSRH